MPDRIGDRTGAADDADLADTFDAESVMLIDGDDIERADIGIHRDVVLGQIRVDDPVGAPARRRSRR